MNVDQDADATQVVSACKKRKEDDITKDMMEGAAQLGLFDETCGESRCKWIIHGTARKDEQMGSTMQRQWVDFEKKCEGKIVQLAPASVKGTDSASKHSFHVSFHNEVDKNGLKEWRGKTTLC